MADKNQASGPLTPQAHALLSADALQLLHQAVPSIAKEAVVGITDEVPAYAVTFSGPTGSKIRRAVELALTNFLELAAQTSSNDPSEPIDASRNEAYRLGRGEARSGRSMDALLSAYRVGARICWRGLATHAANSKPYDIAAFAELVFAYIDALSAASVKGHAAELAAADETLARHRERLADHLAAGTAAAAIEPLAISASWELPTGVCAVLADRSDVPNLKTILPTTFLTASPEPLGLDEEIAVLIVPTTSLSRDYLLTACAGKAVIVGPQRPWTHAAESIQRTIQARHCIGQGSADRPLDTEQHLAELVVTADSHALVDLQRQVLAPLATLKPATAEKLVTTLHAWVICQGRREAIAERLFVHPQTVRYRMTQLRELFGENLEIPHRWRDITVAVAVAETVDIRALFQQSSE